MLVYYYNYLQQYDFIKFFFFFLKGICASISRKILTKEVNILIFELLI